MVLETEKFDLVIISGDITHFSDKTDLKKALDVLDNANIKYYAVTGNCDKPDCEVYLKKINHSLESKVVDFGNFQFAGLSGSLPCPGTTPNEFTEEEFTNKLEKIQAMLFPKKPLIFVTHQPPYKTINDKVLSGLHVGSKSIRKFVEEIFPVVCLTGHIHEGKGVDYIGKCPIINPGPFRNGHYAIVELTGEASPRIELH
jgi:Icc-related predicted phosphoesterase